MACAAYTLDKKAQDVTILDVRGLSTLTDYLVIATGRTDRQVQAIAENVKLGLKRNFEEPPMAIDGVREGRWILIDYGDVMVHIFQPTIREMYDLEGLWHEAKIVEIPEGLEDSYPNVEP